MIEDRNTAKSLNLLAALFLAACGLVCFVSRGTFPWAWPSLDMATYYANVQFGNYISHDFLTSCLGDSNGRALFGKLTGWPISLGLPWYETLYAWMLLNSAAMPFAIYMGLTALISERKSKANFVIFAFVLYAIVFPTKVNYLTVAWWNSWGTFFHPSLLSITTVFLGIYLALREHPAAKICGYGLAFLSSLLHPAYALGAGLFFALILLFHRNDLRSAVFFLISIGLGLIFIKSYSASGSLGADDYSRYFAWLHPEHYIPSRFVAMGSFKWFEPVIYLMAAFFSTYLILYKLKERRMELLPLCFFLFYGTSLLTQYIFVERYPISTLVILISPSRFLAYGYWMLAICSALLAGTVLNKYFPTKKLDSNEQNAITEKPRSKIIATMTLLALCALPIYAFKGFLQLKQPLDLLEPDEKSLIEWIETNTSRADEIASPDFLPVVIPLLTGRGSYSGNGFPFEDRCLKENYIRYTNTRGDPTGTNGRSSARTFYSKLDIEQLSKLSPRPQWAVMVRSSAGAIESLSKAQPAFENGTFLVFRTDTPIRAD